MTPEPRAPYIDRSNIHPRQITPLQLIDRAINQSSRIEPMNHIHRPWATLAAVHEHTHLDDDDGPAADDDGGLL